MPRRVILQALVVLTLLMSATSPAAAAAGETVSMPVAGVEPRFQDQEEGVVEEEIVEDEFSSFTMPGLAPDNLTETVLADIDAFWAGGACESRSRLLRGRDGSGHRRRSIKLRTIRPVRQPRGLLPDR